MKDPAFLFYPGDWLGGTLGMTLKEKGAYMDLLIFQFNRGAFTEKQAIRLLSDELLWKELKFKFESKNDVYWNERLKYEKEKRIAFTESRRRSRLKSNEDNVRIYIVRDNVRSTYKIGSSVNPIRRYNELSNQQNPAIMGDKNPDDRDITLIWYSNPVLRSDEKVLHQHFSNKNLSGEWFSLDKKDLEYIFKKYNGTYYERTIVRTENEDINRDKDKNKDIELLINDFHSYLLTTKYSDYNSVKKWNLDKQYEEVDKIHRIDNHSIDTIKKVLTFIKQDSFWSQQVQSLAGLRKKGNNDMMKFENILTAMNRKPDSKKSGVYREKGKTYDF